MYLIYPSVHGPLGGFYLLATVNYTAVNNGVPDFQFFWQFTQKRFAGSYGNYVFNFLRNRLTLS